jgi:orotate phosphoribosyltransferase
MTPPARKPGTVLDEDAREKIHLDILKRTGAYHANDHILLSSGHHTGEFIEKNLVTTEPSFTEGLGGVIANHFAPWPVDVVLCTGPGALILSHCVARAHPSRPLLAYAIKRVTRGRGGGAARTVTLPAEFERLIRSGTKVLLVEDLVSTGSTLKLLKQLVERLGGQVVGIGALWRRTKRGEVEGVPVFSLVSRDFPTYAPENCPLCRKGVPLNEEFLKRRQTRQP